MDAIKTTLSKALCSQNFNEVALARARCALYLTGSCGKIPQVVALDIKWGYGMKKRFSYGVSGKLVRDKSLDIVMAEDGTARSSYQYLTGSMLQESLLAKLLEEAFEVVGVKDKSELKEELADILQVVEAIKKHNGITQEDLDLAMKKKSELRGGFDKGLFIEWIEIGPCRLYNYCSQHPDQYPELPIAKHD
jgi:predicted house-cleaning noncanonical NTP pyrophosphatase (MazG superfamily)